MFKKNIKRNDVRNNWALLAGVSLVSFGGAAVYATYEENSIAIGVYFLVASVSLAAFAFYWFKDHPPAMKAPWWAYALVVAGLEVGGFLGGSIEGTRAIGAWIAVGLAFVAYGLLERSRLISITGLCAALLGIATYILISGNIGLILEILTGILFGVSAYLLKHKNVK